MEYVQFVQQSISHLPHLGMYSDLSQVGLGHLSWNWADLQGAVLAQQFDTDVFAGTRKVVGEFVASGKLWTLLIGIVIGYILKSLTSYG
jgi:hypothetical protein